MDDLTYATERLAAARRQLTQAQRVIAAARELLRTRMWSSSPPAYERALLDALEDYDSAALAAWDSGAELAREAAVHDVRAFLARPECVSSATHGEALVLLEKVSR
jgi:hypothetical protein